MKRIKDFLIEYQWMIRILVYLLITISCSVYILFNWCDAISFTFFSDFNGLNLLFLVWIVLLILPVIGSMEAFGLKLDFWEQQKQEKINEKQKELEEKIQQIKIDGGEF